MSADPSSRMRLTISSAKSGLPPERSATWATSRRLRCPPAPSGSSASTSSRAPVGLQRLERDRRRVAAAAAPAGAAVEKLVAGEADHEQTGPGPSGPGTRSGRASPRPPSGCPRSRAPRGLSRLAASTSERTAEKIRSRICLGVLGVEPSASALRAPRCRAAARAVAASRSGGSSVDLLGDSVSTPRAACAQAQLGVVGVGDARTARGSISPSAQ